MDSNVRMNKQLRVFLWSVPRSVSTVFQKCISFLPNTQIINEPYVCAFHFGPDKVPALPGTLLTEEYMGKFHKELDNNMMELPHAFDVYKSSYDFIKSECETEFPDKDLVFCKDMAYGLQGKFDKLPGGYRHTFIIRNPYKMFPSYRKLMANMLQGIMGLKEFRFCDIVPPLLSKTYCFQDQYELMTYLQEHGEPHPIIVDADDLLKNPASIMRQYCTLLGIRYSEDMLDWPSGLDSMKSWKGGRQFLLSNLTDAGGFYDEALTSRRFHPAKPVPRREDVPEDVLKCIDHSMPYYEKMYDLRIRIKDD